MKIGFTSILLLCAYTLVAQRDLTLRRVMKVKCPNSNYYIERCGYSILVPVSRPGRQEVLSYSYPSIKPSHVNNTKKKETYLHWNEVSFFALKDSVMAVSMKLRITPYDLKTAKKKPILDKNDLDTASFLKDEENFRANAKSIRAVAAKINGTTREEIVKQIFEFVKDTLDYKIFYFQDRGAKKALKEGKGDCTEYSELMVTLCRAKKIPARIVEGIIPHTIGRVGYHNWVEVYFPDYGWVAFDPTWADHPKASTTFYRMKNSYIQLTNQRFVKHIHAPECNVPFSLFLRDSCGDVRGLNSKFRSMQKFYDDNENKKALELLDTLIHYEPDNYIYWMYKGVALAREGEFVKGAESLEISLKNVETEEEQDFAIFGKANYFALKNEGDSAVASLKALSPGFLTYARIEKDSDFDRVRQHPPFIELVEELKKKEKEAAEKKKE